MHPAQDSGRRHPSGADQRTGRGGATFDERVVVWRIGRSLRELAGLRLLQRRWSEVSDLAAAAVSEDPTDDHAWRLLATSRFVQDDRSGALEAWNHVDEPRVDLVRVDGLVRTRQRVVEDLLPIARNDVLTSERLTRGARQLRELPSAASAN